MKSYIAPTMTVQTAPKVEAAKPATTMKEVEFEIPISIPTSVYYSSMGRIMAEGTGRVESYRQAFNIVVVVGTGGTGGYVVRDLMRYISTLPYAKNTLVVLMDADEVEPKNIGRQNFLVRDIGKNKADVLAGRYGAAFGVKVVSLPKHLTKDNIDTVLSADHFRKLVATYILNLTPEEAANGQTNSLCFNLVLITCVDNNKTRCLISEKLGYDRTGDLQAYRKLPVGRKSLMDLLIDRNHGTTTKSITWIDSGNETDSGQVIVYYDSISSGFAINQEYGHLDFGISLLGKPNVPTYPYTTRRYGSLAEWFLGFTDTPEREGKSVARIAAETYIADCQRKHYPSDHQNKHQRLMKSVRELKPNAEDFAEQTRLSLSMGLMEDQVLAGWSTFPVTYVYPTIFEKADDKLNTELSCAERAVADPQNIMVNLQAASHIMNYVSRILASNPKNAILKSFGCAWKGDNCTEMYINTVNTAKIFGGIVEHLEVTNLKNRVSVKAKAAPAAKTDVKAKEAVAKPVVAAAARPSESPFFVDNLDEEPDEEDDEDDNIF